MQNCPASKTFANFQKLFETMKEFFFSGFRVMSVVNIPVKFYEMYTNILDFMTIWLRQPRNIKKCKEYRFSNNECF